MLARVPGFEFRTQTRLLQRTHGNHGNHGIENTMKILSLLCLAATVCCAAAEKPLNILVLYADDWRYNTLGCAGNPVVKTPHLDQLAREGFRFTQNRVTTAICGVSRASLFTGQWMSRHGNPAFAAFKTPWAETYLGLLRTNGYFVGHIGKWHNGKFPGANYDFGRAYSGTHWIKDRKSTRLNSSHQ